MGRLPKGSAMVEVYGESVIAEYFESLVVMAVHVPHQEVEDGEVHEVQEPPALVVGTDVLDSLAVVLIILPLSFPSLVVAPPPRVPPGLPRDDGLAGEEGGQADLQHVGRAADGVGGVAVVGTLAVEAEVPRGRYEEGLEQVSLSQGVYLPETFPVRLDEVDTETNLVMLRILPVTGMARLNPRILSRWKAATSALCLS